MKLGKINELSIVNSAYASVLTEIPTPPGELFIAGSLPDERRPSVAIVGSRRPTPYGVEVTRRLAKDLTTQGVVIISGLALGIDKIAHDAALEAGGTTIAVLANGLHRVYPASHLGLAQQIIKQGGALVSEKPLSYEARRHDFLARNRLVSGLADAIIVTEATDRSGTLSTVNHALEQNKTVFAVPGPITSLLSVGPNRLIQQGAHVVLNAEDVLSIVAPDLIKTKTERIIGDTPLEVRIIELIRSGVRDGEALLAQSEAATSEFLQTMSMLELKGNIRPLGGNRWSI